uniref:Ribosome maturation protein SDO1/SBDS N-terminal domain-containing protein n=1 Tax=Piliocolobus tephrosceles TaxID=591936 RepID=A0A8C9GG80_9PRIM
MGALFQPINQVKFTNVAVVKYKYKGKKFEIACYKNKIIDWKNGVELNIDDVLQSHLIFTNISKGEIAKKSELTSCFNSNDNYEICKTILEKGTLQISNKERTVMKDKVYKDVIEILHEMSVNPQTGYPLSTNMIESYIKMSLRFFFFFFFKIYTYIHVRVFILIILFFFLISLCWTSIFVHITCICMKYITYVLSFFLGIVKNIGYSINLDDSAKKQALKLFDVLSKEYKDVIQRAFMRIQIICDDSIKNEVINFLNNNNVIIEEEKITDLTKREDNENNAYINTNHSSSNINDVCEYTSNTPNDKKMNCISENNKEEGNINDNKNNTSDSDKNKTVDNSKNDKKISNNTLIENKIDCIHNVVGNNVERVGEVKREFNEINYIRHINNNDNININSNNNTNHKLNSEIFDNKRSNINEECGLLENNYSNNDEEEKNKIISLGSHKKNNETNETTTNECITNEHNMILNTNFKKKKQDNKEKMLKTYKIVFLCYPYVYRYINDFTQKYKKTCSCKILSNNVKIVSSNKKKINETKQVSIEGEDTEKKKEKTNNKSKNIVNTNLVNNNAHSLSSCGEEASTKKKKSNKNAKNSNKNLKNDNNSISNGISNSNNKKNKKNSNNNSNTNTGEIHINNNYVNSNINNDIQQIPSSNTLKNNLTNEHNVKINSTDVIMCTSCAIKIEKSNYKIHCRSDFHVYNVKRKYKKLPPITLEEYVEIDFDTSHFHVDM